MGLDNFWINDNKEAASCEGEFNVCGGMLSGHGNDSFRGKVYSSIVEAASGVSLYSQYIDNATVRMISQKLQEMPYDEAVTHSDYGLTEDGYKGFQQMFKAHAEAGHSLTGWW